MKSGSARASKFICVEYETFQWRHMLPGKERRKAIIDHILQLGDLCVNRRYCLQTHQDSDLKVMLKKGILKRSRSRSWGKDSYQHYTYLILA